MWRKAKRGRGREGEEGRAHCRGTGSGLSPMGPLGEFQPLGGCVTRTLMPSLPPVNKGARECFMGLCLKINEVRTCRGSCLARKVGVHIFPREQRVREGQAGEHAHIWKILHTSVSTVSSSGSPGWECVTFFSLLLSQYLESNLRREDLFRFTKGRRSSPS